MKKKILFMLAMLMVFSTFAIACDKEEKILLTVSSPTVKAGETVQLTSDVSGVTFSLVDSDAIATVNDSGLITAKADAAAGSTIKAVAKKGDVTSNTVQIAVIGGEVSEKIVLTVSSPTVKAGQTVQLTSDVSGVTFSLVDSDAIATVNAAGLITVKSNAAVGATIKAVAKKGDVTSNTVQIAVIGDEVGEKIVLSASSPSVKAGETVQLTSDVSGVTYSLIDSDENATVNANGLIQAKSTATAGEIIKAQAKKGTVESNIVQILILGDTEEKILLTASAPSVRAGGTVTFTSDTDDVTYLLLDTINFAQISATGVLTVNASAEAGTIIKVYAQKGTVISNIVQILVVADEKILLTANSPSVKAGGTVTFTSDTDGVTYLLLDTINFAQISATGVLTVNASAEAGAIIRVSAQKGTMQSNIVNILVVANEKIILTVSTPVVELDGTVELTADVAGVTFLLIDNAGAEVTETANASVNASGLVTIKNDATIGASIKAVAKKGDIYSNEIQIIIIAGETEEKIILTADAITVQPGGTVELTSDVEDVTFSIVGNSSNATINATTGVVTANSNATVGAVISVMAQKGNSSSNIVAITVVDIPATSITNITATKTSLMAGESTTFNCDVAPNNTTQTVTWTIANGYAKASIVGNTLTVAADATPGQIVVMAKAGDVTGIIVLTVHGPLTAITISANKSEVQREGTVQFSAVLTPSNTLQTDITWEIVTAGAKAQINSTGLLTVLSDAALGDKIKVVAKRGSITSNEIEITVRELGYYLNNQANLENSTLVIKNTDTTSTPVLQFGIVDELGNPVSSSDMTIEYAVKAGDEDIVSLQSIGAGVCLVIQSVHGEAEIIVTLKDVDGVIDTDSVIIKSIKTPSSIILPEYLETSTIALTGLDYYSVGIEQEFNYAARIPNVQTQGNLNYGASTDVEYKIELLDDSNGVAETGDTVGTITSGKIIFKKTGKIKVTATTNSGNTIDKEKSVSYIFDVNEYKNISNWEDLKNYFEGSEGGSTRAVNFVVTERPTADYGFSIVPGFLLQTGAEHYVSLEDLKGLYTPDGVVHDDWYRLQHIGIYIVDKNVIIRGNNHAIDYSKMPTLNYPSATTLIEINGSDWQGGNYGGTNNQSLYYLAQSIGLHQPNMSANFLETLNPQFTQAAPVYSVDFDSLRIYGNTSIDGKNLNGNDLLSGEKPTTRWGTHSRAIEIGYYLSRANFAVTMNNVEVRNFQKGITIHRAVNEEYQGTTYVSKLSNFNVSDIYGSGLEIAMSQIELHNATFGFTGAGPFEALNQFTTMAGMAENKKQRIEFTGNYNPGPANNGNTQYYQDYTVIEASLGGDDDGGIRFHMILNSYITTMNLSQKNHVNFTGGAFMFSTFALNDPFYASELQAAASAGVSEPVPIIPGMLLGNFQIQIFAAITQKLGGAIGGNFSEIVFPGGASAVANMSSVAAADNTTAKYILMDVVIDASTLGVPGLTGIFQLGRVYVVNAKYTGQ